MIDNSVLSDNIEKLNSKIFQRLAPHDLNVRKLGDDNGNIFLQKTTSHKFYPSYCICKLILTMLSS